MVKNVETLTVEGLDWPVTLRRHPRASRLSLKVSKAKRQAILTVPPYETREEAQKFLTQHLVWLEKKLGDIKPPVPFTEGALIPLKGTLHRLVFTGKPAQRGKVCWRWHEEDQPSASPAPPRLYISGALEHAPRRLKDWLKNEARKALDKSVCRLAERLQRTPRKISVRDQISRWGSCSETGVLSFSWRLILAPPAILDYVAAHEVAHLREMNHSPRFWALVDEIYGDICPAQTICEARIWLNKNGADLHRYGLQPATEPPELPL